MIKRIVLLISLLCAISLPVFADETRVYFNDEKLVIPEGVIIENGSTLVPMRLIFERLGFTIDWNGAARSVSAKHSDFEIKLAVEQKTADVNGVEMSLAVAPHIINGTTYVPLRFVSEVSGANVNYSEPDRTIRISTAASDATVTFTDVNLDKAMRLLIDKKAITKRDLFYLRNLEIKRSGVTNLKGLEFCTNLEFLDLSGNRIGRIDEIAQLNKLKEVNLSNNQLQSIKPLTALPNLSSVDVSQNRITSFEALSDMKALKRLSIANNSVQDLTSLFYIESQLDYLDIDRSLIERPKFNTPVATTKADFAFEVAQGVSWVPVYATGGSKIENETMDTLVKQGPNAKQNQIQTPFEVMQMLYLNPWLRYSDLKTEYRGITGTDWIVYPSGRDTLRTNQGGAIGLAVACDWLLSMDYMESGLLYVSKEDNKFYLLNYIKTEKRVWGKDKDGENDRVTVTEYYTFNPAAYLPQSGLKYADETGLKSDFDTAATPTDNMLRADSLDELAAFIAGQDPHVQLICKMRQDSPDANAFAVGYEAGHVVFPSALENATTVLYKRNESIQDPRFKYLNLKTEFFTGTATFESYMYK